MALLAILVKAVSRGPVVFKQERVGYGGEPFTCFKFRSMKVDATTKIHEEYLKLLIQSNAPMTKLDESGDSRLIPLGRFIRSAGMDELPQLLNVIRGEMSLVGPRPCTPHEFSSARRLLSKRLAAPPGLTGYWQVNGKNRTTFRRMVAMDILYAKNMSVPLDLKILLQTFPALVSQALCARRAGPGKQAAANQAQEEARNGRYAGFSVQKEEKQ